MKVSLFLKLINLLILCGGLGAAWVVYQRADITPSGIVGYEQGEGGAYPILPEDSKKYLRDLELYGGKANVLMDGIRRWFMGLWRGKSLAFTLSGLTILSSLGIFYLSRQLSSSAKPHGRQKHKRVSGE